MNTTLDAWEILETVVQVGGFAAAAEKLNRSQSTISYAVGRLQDQLGVNLFEIKGRKGFLTEAGRVLLADVVPHLEGFRQIEQRARMMASGGASEVNLSVDSIFPSDRLFSALANFTAKYPLVQPKLRQGTFLSAESEFLHHNAQLCITGLMARELYVKPILVVRLIAVARRGHPLHAIKRKLLHSDLIRYMGVTITGSASGALKQQPWMPAQRLLPVCTVDAAIAAVRSGLCFGWLPQYCIQSDLASGDLKILPLPLDKTRDVCLNLVCKNQNVHNKEISTLADLLGAKKEPEIV